MQALRKAALAALLAVALQAQAAEHVRGDYRFETIAEPDFVERADIPAQWPADAPGANDTRWRYWLYDRQVDHRGGRDRDYVEHVYEVRSPSLLGDAGRFQIDFVPEFQKLAIHRVEVRRDGAWTSRLDPARISLARREGEFEQDIANGAVTALVVLDDVRVGDVIRVSYTVEGANPVLKGQDTDWAYVGYHNPVLDSRARMLYDPGTRLRTQRQNTGAEPVVRQSPTAVEASLRATRVAPTIDHGDYPRWHTPFPLVQVGPDQTWSQVVDWALPLYPAVTAPLPADLEARLVQWRALPDPAARLTAALRAVQDEVRYFGIEMGETTHRPHAPSETWTRRFGDCKDKAYLLVTLLGRLGIEAVPALVSSSDGRAVANYLPAADAFDHVIVRAKLDGRAVWMDPTLTQQGGDPRRADLSWLGVGLPVARGVRGFETIARPADANDGVESTERFVIERADAPVAFSVETVYRGGAADHARRTLGSDRSEDLARRYAEHYGKRYGEVETLHAPRIEDDRVANVLRVVESYRLPKALDASGAVRSLDLYPDVVSPAAAVPKSLEHPGPLAVPSAVGRYRQVSEVVVPAQWSARFGADRSEHASSAFDFKRDVEIDGTTARVTIEMDVTAGTVDSKDVRAYIASLDAVRDDLSSTLRFQLPAALQATDREKRLRALLRDAAGTGEGK